MRDSGFGTLRIAWIDSKKRSNSSPIVVGRMADDVEAGFADVRKMSDSEFRQLKQAITFWGGRVRAVDDRDALRRRG